MSPTGYNDKLFFRTNRSDMKCLAVKKGRRGGKRDLLCVSLVAILAKVLTVISERGSFHCVRQKVRLTVAQHSQAYKSQMEFT